MAERNDRDVTPAVSDDRSRDAREGGRRTDGPGGRPKSNRGFASMDPARQREIASKGGRAAHEKGTAHEWTPEEARQAGRKGGEIVSRDRAHMAAIGREGGGARSTRGNRAGQNASTSENGGGAGVQREGGEARAGEANGGAPASQ
jgi:general stress protein YciG